MSLARSARPRWVAISSWVRPALLSSSSNRPSSVAALRYWNAACPKRIHDRPLISSGAVEVGGPPLWPVLTWGGVTSVFDSIAGLSPRLVMGLVGECLQPKLPELGQDSDRGSRRALGSEQARRLVADKVLAHTLVCGVRLLQRGAEIDQELRPVFGQPGPGITA